MYNTTHRTSASEIMDDFELEGEEPKDALDKIAKINQLLGGNRLTLKGKNLKQSKKSRNCYCRRRLWQW
jgi:hypothetical protein